MWPFFFFLGRIFTCMRTALAMEWWRKGHLCKSIIYDFSGLDYRIQIQFLESNVCRKKENEEHWSQEAVDWWGERKKGIPPVSFIVATFCGYRVNTLSIRCKLGSWPRDRSWTWAHTEMGAVNHFTSTFKLSNLANVTPTRALPFGTDMRFHYKSVLCIK